MGMKKLKLKSLRVSKVSQSGETICKTIKRGIPGERPGYAFDHFQAYDYEDDENVLVDEDPSYDPIDSSDDNCLGSDQVGFLSDYKDLPSLHEIKEKANVAAWVSIRSSLLRVVVENNALPFMQICTKCLSNPASVKCRYCGSGVYYCEECIKLSHTQESIFHVPEI